MGTCGSRIWRDRMRALRDWRDEQLENGSRNSYKHECKVLLLGARGSGKSTIMKQMKIQYQNGYSDKELLSFRPLIWKNLVQCIHAIVGRLEKSDIDLIHPHRQASLRRLVNYTLPNDGGSFDPAIAQVVYDLWTDCIIPALTEHPFEFDLMDSESYFLEHCRRIGQPDYRPTTDDVLRAREQGIGITEMQFIHCGLLVHVFDVGGPCLERKEWIRSFEYVTSIVFCVALSEYDQVSPDEKDKNRMIDSLALFDSVVNSHLFLQTSFVLFLNRIDVFKRKLPKVPLENTFPDYTGGSDVNKGAKYILWQFLQANRARVSVYPHIAEATSTHAMRLIFVTVKETVLQNPCRVSDLL